MQRYLLGLRSRQRSSCAGCARLLAVASLLSAAALSQSPGAAAPLAAAISPRTQAGIARDIARHFGDAPAYPGPHAPLSGSLRPPAVRAAMRKVANWELARAQPYFGRNWTWSALYAGFMAASHALHTPRYRDAMRAMAAKFQWRLRSSAPSADDQSLAQTYLELYLRRPAPQKIAYTRRALAALMAGAGPPIPRLQARIPWWWCDALFMAPPVWSRMYAATGDRQYLAYLDRHFRQTSRLLYDRRYHLYYRDITFLHQRDRRGHPVFWSRGEGWVMGGLARTLAYLPPADPAYGRYARRLRQMAAAVAALQDPNNGLWHSGLLDAQDYPQPETSGSALIVFALAWADNRGLLDNQIFLPVIAKAWRGLVRQIYADGRLGNIQQTGSAPAHYLPSSSYNYGVGAFLLAGAQVSKLPIRWPAQAPRPPAARAPRRPSR